MADKLSDEAVAEIKAMLDEQYRSGYEYAEFRRTQSAKCGVPEKPAEEVLKVVLAPVTTDYFRSMLRG